jgi:8-oxo-dGTP pyrophosphatase MutT (NUDIX family)
VIHWLDLTGPNPWRTRSSRVVYDNGRLRLCADQVIQPDGEPGETPPSAAQRELAEEDGSIEQA